MKKCSERYEKRNQAVKKRSEPGVSSASWTDGLAAERARGEVEVVHGH